MRKRNMNGGDSGAGGVDPKEAVARARGQGRLDSAQAEALLKLISRMGVLGFEDRQMISDMVVEIAREDSAGKRTKLVRKLKEHLEGDRLAKDLAPVLSEAFAID